MIRSLFLSLTLGLCAGCAVGADTPPSERHEDPDPARDPAGVGTLDHTASSASAAVTGSLGRTTHELRSERFRVAGGFRARVD